MGLKKRRRRSSPLDTASRIRETKGVLQLSGNKTLADLGRGDAATLYAIDLPANDAQRLMELGFIPGSLITAGLSAPGGDPRVFQVDGSEIALRRETARHLKVRTPRIS